MNVLPLIVIYVNLILTHNRNTQNTEFIRIITKPALVEEGRFEGYLKYDFDVIEFYSKVNGINKTVIITNCNKIIYELQDSISDVMIYKPVFFKDPYDRSKGVLFVESATEFSWGQSVLMIENNTLYECGFIDYGVEEGDRSSIALVSNIENVNDSIQITFENVKLYQCSNEENQPMGDKIKYHIKNYKIFEITN